MAVDLGVLSVVLLLLYLGVLSVNIVSGLVCCWSGYCIFTGVL